MHLGLIIHQWKEITKKNQWILRKSLFQYGCKMRKKLIIGNCESCKKLRKLSGIVNIVIWGGQFYYLQICINQ